METASERERADNVIELGLGDRARGRRTRAPAGSTCRRATIAPEDWARFRASVAEIFEAFGMDLDTPGTRDTPERFLRALFEATAGYDGDPKLQTTFPAESARPSGVAGSARSSRGRSSSTACASTTRCRSSASRTSATSPASGSSASRS